MTKARSEQVSTEETPYYHCVSRCVRRAFLCGTDQETGECYEHRRQWIADRIRLLCSIFQIDTCAYAVMSNHYHIVVRLGDSSELTNAEVIERWLSLYKGPTLIQRYVAGTSLGQAELNTISDIICVWRERLQSLSWFMKCLNEPIARMANTEDKCTGHFWESRFKCQPLLSEEALLTCMAYVDLNPVRAAMADTPENSDFTSIQERIKPRFDPDEAKQSQLDAGHLWQFPFQVAPLLHFDDATKNEAQCGIPFSLIDYLQLIDWSGRVIKDNKRGYISNAIPPILNRLNILPDEWLFNSQAFEKIIHRKFKRAALDRDTSASTGARLTSQ